MKIKDIRKMSDTELLEEILASKKEIFNLRLQAAAGELVKTHLYRSSRKRIAKIKTVLTEKRVK